ncbi:serine/threonine protein kinase [Actinotalea sp. K2]|uniref:serine/threonine protein kinase n=1 Tax=Actinotalea sp. K2 TaxID=2939438 RepID=UPI002016BC5C|nr:serine/threonine-protein kinase [Actinotalea sp. K2]MCL3862294.1 protein kinase [Actinotalea sp. K2]
MATRVLQGRYELRRLIGSGGMAQVWEAQDSVLERLVAVKTVDLAGADDPTLAERLQREAVATATLVHPDIVTVYDAGVEGSTAFFVMELLAGRDLAAVLRDGQLRVDDAVRIGERVSGALAAAHAAGIVHRDVKPGNVVVDGGQVTVVDFGIAAVTRAAQASLTAVGTVLGTAQYVAPEQADGGRASPASDMYAVGCFLTALLTGSGPFTGEDPMDVLRQHVTATPRRLRDVRPELPPALDDLVSRLLAKEPAARPTAEQAQELLGTIASSMAGSAASAAVDGGTKVLPVGAAGASATPGGRSAIAAVTPALPPSIPVRRSATDSSVAVAASEPGPRRRRSPGLLIAAGVLVLVLAVAAIALGTGSPEVPGDSDPPVAGGEVPAGPQEEPVDEPAQEPPAEVPSGPVAVEDVPALLATLDVEDDVRADLGKRWERILEAVEKDEDDKAAKRSGEMVRRVDERVVDGALSPEEGAVLRAALVAGWGEPAADEDKGSRNGDDDEDDEDDDD